MQPDLAEQPGIFRSLRTPPPFRSERNAIWLPSGDHATLVSVQKSGKVTTTLSPDKTPITTFQGTWNKVKGTGRYQGITGSGNYKGHFTSQTEYTVDSRPSDAIALADRIVADLTATESVMIKTADDKALGQLRTEVFRVLEDESKLEESIDHAEEDVALAQRTRRRRPRSRPPRPWSGVDERVFFGAFDPDAEPIGFMEKLGARFLKMPAARTTGVGKPAAATAPCTIVSLRAEPGSGISRATSSAGQPSGGLASENDSSSAQKPPCIGSGLRSYSRSGAPAALRSTAISRSAMPVSTVTVFTVTVFLDTV